MSPRDASSLHAPCESSELSSPMLRAGHRLGHPMSLPSCSCICGPARIRPNCGESAGDNPKHAGTASDNGGTRSGRTACSAVFPADLTRTANNASNQPGRNLASIPIGLQPPNTTVRRPAAPARTVLEGHRFHCTLHQPNRIQYRRHTRYRHRLCATDRLWRRL